MNGEVQKIDLKYLALEQVPQKIQETPEYKMREYEEAHDALLAKIKEFDKQNGWIRKTLYIEYNDDKALNDFHDFKAQHVDELLNFRVEFVFGSYIKITLNYKPKKQ